MRDLAKLRALTGTERRLLVVSVAAIPFVAAGVAIFGFGKTRALLSRWPRPGTSRFPSQGAAWARAQSTARVVAIAAGRGPVRTSCLRRSLLTWWLLRHDGIETALRVGVNRDGGTIHAHAWLEYRGVPLYDADDVALRFPAFAQDFGVSPVGTP